MCHKEFLAVVKDPKTRAILFVPALVQSLLFGYAATFALTAKDVTKDVAKRIAKAPKAL
eukprot:gene23223-26290_t